MSKHIHIHLAALERPKGNDRVIRKVYYSNDIKVQDMRTMKRKKYITTSDIIKVGGAIEVTYKKEITK